MTRCEVTDLLVEQCAHCVAPTKPTPPDPFGTPEPARSPWFLAAFNGECSNCGVRIDEGDEIRADGEGGYEGYECCHV